MTPPAPAPASASPSHASVLEAKFAARYGRPESPRRSRAYQIIFESDTRAGRLFDLALIILIMASVAVVILDSVQSLTAKYDRLFNVLEWAFTIVFTIEYLLRLSCVRHPLRYAASFWGVVDLLSFLPTYFAFFIPSFSSLINVRLLRLLRIFRILKLSAYVSEFNTLGEALVASRRKITVFIGFVLVADAILGTLMYIIEGPQNGFTSIPVSMYWAITTMTTVGFGDITPKTDLGRFVSSCIMLLGWGILAVPTGIVTAEMTARRVVPQALTRRCPGCLAEGHDLDAEFCKRCGAALALD